MLLPGETLEDIELRAERLLDEDLALLEELVAWRVKRGLQQKDVAARMGVSQAAISQFESLNGNPTFQTVRRYANAVGVRISHTIQDDLG